MKLTLKQIFGKNCFVCLYTNYTNIYNNSLKCTLDSKNFISNTEISTIPTSVINLAFIDIIAASSIRPQTVP